jgi:hypothetical protein
MDSFFILTGDLRHVLFLAKYGCSYSFVLMQHPIARPIT